MGQVDCQIIHDLNIPASTGEPSSLAVTVGQVFGLRCNGDFSALTSEELQIKLPETQKYALKLLGVEKVNSSEYRFKVTSYLVGSHQLKGVELSATAGGSVSLGDLSFNVESVQDPQNPQKEPFGPRGPLGLQLPWTFWAGVIAILLALLALSIAVLYRRIQRHRLLQELLKKDSSSPPPFQFHHTVRQVIRREPLLLYAENKISEDIKIRLLNDLEQAWRLFLGRSLLIPAHVWPERLILKELKKKNRSYFKEHGELSRRLFAELKRARTGQQDFHAKDFLQIVEHSRQCVDSIQDMLHPKKTRGVQ